MKPEDRFDHVRERPVADVMNQCRNTHRGAVIVRYRIPRTQPIKNARCKMISAEAVRESRMLRRLICEVSKAQLPDPPQPLKFGRINEARDQRAYRVVRIDADNIVD